MCFSMKPGTTWKTLEAPAAWLPAAAPEAAAEPEVYRFTVEASEQTPCLVSLSRTVTIGSELPEDGAMSLGIVPEHNGGFKGEAPLNSTVAQTATQH